MERAVIGLPINMDGSIGPAAKQVIEWSKSLAHRVEILFVDDASPDGTGEIADRLAAELPWVGVLRRKRKEGLGPAYLAGEGIAHLLEGERS